MLKIIQSSVHVATNPKCYIRPRIWLMVICIGHSTLYVLIQSESIRGPAVSHRWVLSLSMRSTEFGTVDK